MNYASVKSSIANIYSNPDFRSELITQAIILEKIKIIDKKNNWYFIKQNDNYCGWIHKFYVSSEIININTINTKFLLRVYKTNKLIDSIYTIPFSSGFNMVEKNKDFSIIMLYNADLGYIENIQNIKENNKREAIYKFSMMMINVPYLWGGKSIYGYDCSGFVQTIFRAAKINIPRDSKDQYMFLKKSNKNKTCDNPQSGDLIFFSKKDKIISHVAIYLKDQLFIHSAGNVKINSFNDNDLVIDFELNQFLISIYSIDSILN